MLTKISTKMHENRLLQSLEDFGLNEKEAKIYFAALSLGPTTIQKIAQMADIKRTTVYSLIESLKQKGLVTIQVDGFKKKFTAEDPAKLTSILDKRKKALQSLLPEFAALYNLRGGESSIKYYEGIEAVKGVYESMIRDIRPGEDYLIVSNQDELFSLDKEYYMDFIYRRAKLPIKIRALLQNSPQVHEWLKIQKNINTKIKILPKETKLKTNLVVTPRRVLIHQLSAPILGIVIENKSVIQMHTEMFEIIWNSVV